MTADGNVQEKEKNYTRYTSAHPTLKQSHADKHTYMFTEKCAYIGRNILDSRYKC